MMTAEECRLKAVRSREVADGVMAAAERRSWQELGDDWEALACRADAQEDLERRSREPY